MFDPKIGQFISEDPTGFDPGDPDLRRYVGNSPTNFTDPTGLEQEPAGPPPTAVVPKGTPENRYHGLGEWEWKSAEEIMTFYSRLLNPEANNFPDEWRYVIQRGCIGLNLVRIGWGDTGRPPVTHFAPGRSLTGVSYFLSAEDAWQAIRRLSEDNKDKQYILFAIQMPLKKAHTAATVRYNCEGKSLDETNLLENVPCDTKKAGDFNVATWIPYEKEHGYWEFVDREFHTGISEDKTVTVKHVSELPARQGWMTVYGVTYRRKFDAK